jgi:hypothetical protein
MFCNICAGDMGKIRFNNHASIITYQDSDLSIPLFLQLCNLKIQSFYKCSNDFVSNCKSLLKM